MWSRARISFLVLKFIGVFFAIHVVTKTEAAVWEATGPWDQAQEARYSEWIEKEFGESFFLEGDWGGIKTDCADAVYGARIIFSFLNGLPFALSATDARFSNQTTAFDLIADPRARVRAFLDFVNDKTWTGSLSRHTYPVALDRTSIVPGVIWLKPGHVETVQRVRTTGVVDLRGSWLPGAIRRLVTITTLGYVPVKTSHGFRRWIWPQNLGRPPRSQPGYSESQFQSPPPLAPRTSLEEYRLISAFESHVRRRLGTVFESSKSRVTRLSHDFCALVTARAEIVRLGYDFFSRTARCLNKQEYEAFSTPSRDSNLRRVVIGLGLDLGNNLNDVDRALQSCAPLPISETESVSPAAFLRKLLTLDFSSDPHQTPTARFGSAAVEPTCMENEAKPLRLNGG